jgi:hypothetical protein
MGWHGFVQPRNTIVQLRVFSWAHYISAIDDGVGFIEMRIQVEIIDLKFVRSFKNRVK